jgi:hypothetical protein
LLEQANKRHDDGHLHFSTLKFETDLMNNLLPDVFAILQGDQELIKDISILRLQTGPINTKITTFHSLATNPDRMNFHLQTHNDYIKYIEGDSVMMDMSKQIKEFLFEDAKTLK